MRNILTGFFFLLCAPAWGQTGVTRGYVGSEACVECHQDAAELWRGSHHAQAWMEARPDTVLGDFDGAEFRLGEMVARFERDGADYMVEVTELDGTTTRHKVHSLGGIAPLQQLLIETEPGNVQSFDVVWDVEDERWYHLYPDQNPPPEDGLHWTGPYKNWNARCAECHATDYRRNYDLQTGNYSPVQSEIGVGCEACHGPGQDHIDWTLAGGPPPPDYGFSAALDSRDAVFEQCAACHSRREPLIDGNPLPGTPFHDVYNLALLRGGLYHADGQIQDEVYVAGSFLQSKMYAQGVGCMDCHQPHSGELIAEGNAICTQCHSEAGNPDFPTLALAIYDSPDHHFHPEGAECKTCHMIERVYMGIDGRRDHSFRVPRPDLGARIGAPDACTDCHADQTQDWAAEHIEAWYPDSTHRGPHYGEAIAAGRQNPMAAALPLSSLAMDTARPGIARATALYLLQNAQLSPDQINALSPTLRDEDPLVRSQAVLLQRDRPERARVGAVVPLLSDPRRSVRLAAARAMIGTSPQAVRGPAAERLSAAYRDWQDSLQTRLDYPETHLVLGGFALTLRNFDMASAAFGQVTRLDPQRVDAWVMQIRIAAAQGQRARAAQLMQEAQSFLPDDPGLAQVRRDLGL